MYSKFSTYPKAGFKIIFLPYNSPLSGGRETIKVGNGQSNNYTSPEFAQEGNIWGNSRTTPGNTAEWVY